MTKDEQKLYSRSITLLKERKEPQMGSQEYQRILGRILDDISFVKKSLKPRQDKSFRKEADRIQQAINTLRYLLSKSQRIQDNNAILQESSESEDFDIRDSVSFFLRNLK